MNRAWLDQIAGDLNDPFVASGFHVASGFSRKAAAGTELALIVTENST
jgi:hypothetical protein